MASTLTRGPLPAKVYWRRRIVVLGGALAVVLALGRLLGGGSDGSSDDPGAAQQVAGEQSSSAPSESPTATRTTKKKPRPDEPITPPTSRAPALAVPDGPCADDDISVTPVITEVVGGRKVPIELDVRTISDEACTWRVSPGHLTLSITSGADDIWSSQQCPAAIPVTDLIVRRAVSTSLTVAWNGKRSDEDCSRLTGWAMPGYYHVAAAALGGEPADVQFKIVRPDPEIVVETTPPGGKGGKGAGDGAGAADGAGAGAGSGAGAGAGSGSGAGNQPGAGKPEDDATTASPSGAVEPNG